ncbi:hypothetical protein R9X47_26420 [Wukongibacter baidiensis]|uniref:hypothetical protein n=1 Tax=Wukongibacter baidiensis TaxID=1723361 RepID=UPI003D7FF9CE
MDKKKIFIILILISISWIGNLIYYYSQQLSEPLFLNHYYEMTLDNDTSFDIYYLINKNKDIDLRWAEIPGIEDVKFELLEYDVETFNHQMLKRGRFKININAFKEVKLEEDKYIFNEIIAHFSNDEVKRVDIGKVIIYKEDSNNIESPIIGRSSGSSSTNRQYRLFEANKPLTIMGFDYDLKKYLDGFLYIFLDYPQSRSNKLTEVENKEKNDSTKYKGDVEDLFSVDGVELRQELFPIKLNKEENIIINNRFYSKDNEDERRYNYYQIYARLRVETEDGEEYIRDCEMHYNPYFDNSDIVSIIKERRGR